MSHPHHSQTNGASLEDSHSNFFSLTDVCGIKWMVFREDPSLTIRTLDPGEDPVLTSFRKCLEAELLSVWRRVPKRALVTYTFDMSGNQVQTPTSKNENEKNLLTQRKELWIFWYGDKPEETFKKLVNPSLKEVNDISGTWENGLPYEARTLLYKALNNLIERSLVSKDFVRLGKWFVQPFDGPDKPLHKSSHLSFSFQYFVHGESSVCASVDVRQHPAVRRLSLHHLSLARGGQASPLHVILAPYGLAATLTGVSYRNTSSEGNVAKLLREWHHFYPLDRNKYYCMDNYGELVCMPPAVEVCVAGVKLVYPTCYVLITDIDNAQHNYGESLKTMHTFRNSDDAMLSKSDLLPYEPSPYTTSNHPLLSSEMSNSNGLCQAENVWYDGVKPVLSSNNSITSGNITEDNGTSSGTSSNSATGTSGGLSSNSSVTEMLSHWDFNNPGRILKKKSRSRSNKERSSNRNRFSNPKIPFHKKLESLAELGWALDQHEAMKPSSLQNVSVTAVSEKNKDSSASPATPGCLAATTPKQPVLASPAPVTVASGPLTPLDSSLEVKPPNTPVPTYPGVTSPFAVTASLTTTTQSMSSSTNKTEIKCESVFSSSLVAAKSDEQSMNFKRPALPMKEYEDDLVKEDKLSDTIYDYEVMTAWLNHPVKKFRPAEVRSGDPLRPMYRRNSQQFDETIGTSAASTTARATTTVQSLSSIKSENKITNGEAKSEDKKVSGNNTGGLLADPYEFSDADKNKQPQNEEDKKDWLTSDGLKPSMDDLDNLFDDSSDETEPPGVNPTPPNSNKPSGTEEDIKSKMASKIDPTGNLPHDQLAKMFPTPPSHEHNPIASPAEDMEVAVKTEQPGSPWGATVTAAAAVSVGNVSANQFITCNYDLGELSEDSEIMYNSSKFGPLPKLYSDDLPHLIIPPECVYKPKSRTSSSHQYSSSSITGSGLSAQTPNSVTTPLLTPIGGPASNKPGMSPISPLHSAEGPRSHHGPGSVSSYPAGLSSPASVSSSYNKNGKISAALAAAAAAAASPVHEKTDADEGAPISLILNLVLSETLLNLFRDHNFDSCTMCVCDNEGNIKGRDAAVYLSPEFSGDEDVNCTCGYSAVVNRRLAHQSGLFYEDEAEVTSITEDLYYRKKTSLLLLDPKGVDEQHFSAKSNVVDNIPASLLELINEQAACSPQHPANALVKYSKQYLKANQQPPGISMVELMDGNDVIFVSLEQVKNNLDQGSVKLDVAQKGTCLHKWTLLQVNGPYCSEDIIRVMKSLQPTLNETLHVRKSQPSALSVQGPLTWRQFHRMAGPATKGNTDDQCEPLPVPSVTVGHERDFLSISPLALHFWEALSLEPFSQPRDIAYIVVAPDNEFLLNATKTFFKNLSSIYELCRLGKHVPITRVLRDGILKVSRSFASKLANDETEEWFDLIGDSPTASLLKLYSQVCRHYLLPHLQTIPFDRSLLENAPVAKQILVEKPTPASPMPPPSMGQIDNLVNMTSSGSSSSSSAAQQLKDSSNDDGKENILGGLDSPVEEHDGGEAPAIIIYMVDPFSMSVENSDMNRLSNMGLLRCFAQMLPHFNEVLKHNIYLQLVSMENILELCQSKSQSRMPDQLRGMAFSVYSQAQRPLQYLKDCKTLTGFGPASSSEKYLKSQEEKAKMVRHLYCPSFVLAPPPVKKKTSDGDSFGSSSNERSSVLFCNYCLSEDQHWLLASCCDDRGELLKTVVINIEIPNKTRRKKASARRVGLRKLMDWILGVMAMNLVPWRLVIGRIGRIGHGELRGWSVLLSRKSLKKASMLLREMCCWTSDVPSILSACLVSMEPDSHLRLMSDQFTPDERFGQTASNCQLSTPKDASCTHILVFPTSATAQSSQEAFRDHQDGIGSTNNDLDDFGLPDIELDQGDDGVGGMDIGDIKDLFEDTWTGGGGNLGSPGSPKRNSLSQPSSPMNNGDAAAFKYGQEEPGERIEILQQPLALGYLVSTAKTGAMPRWFWASCPHLENVSPVFLKSSLHINVASVLHGGDDGFTTQSGRVHSLDSTYTTDVLRYVLEGYNALSWLSLDSVTHDRNSCLPLHIQVLSQIYGGLAALV